MTQHKELIAELSEMLASHYYKIRHGTLAAAVQVITTQDERLNVIYGVDAITRRDVKIEALREWIAELERASAAQGEPDAWIYRCSRVAGGYVGSWQYTDNKEFARDCIEQYGYQVKAIWFAAPPSPDTDNAIEKIAQQWDGCMYDGVGGMIDIGASIRTNQGKENG